MSPQTGPEQSDGVGRSAADQSLADQYAPDQDVPDQDVPDQGSPDQDTARHDSGARPAAEPSAAPAARVLPAQSREDTDVGWGDYRNPDDDDRLLRDRPPHWGNG